MRERWARIWPNLLAAATLSAVGGPAAVASYRHARDVIAQHRDPVLAPWLALTTDGMLLAALVVIWVRRHRGEHVKAGPGRLLGRAWPRTSQQRGRPRWASSSRCGRLTSALELVALVASPANKQPIVTNATPAEWVANAPVDAWFRSVDGEVMDCCGQPDESSLATAAPGRRGADLGCCCRTLYHLLARDSALYGVRSRQVGSSTCIAPARRAS